MFDNLALNERLRYIYVIFHFLEGSSPFNEYKAQ